MDSRFRENDGALKLAEISRLFDLNFYVVSIKHLIAHPAE